MCRLWKQAYYNASNCEALVSCAAELQGLVLANTSLAARPTLMANLLEAVTEVKEFIATFSERSVPLMVLSACLLVCMRACVHACMHSCFWALMHAHTSLSVLSVFLSVYVPALATVIAHLHGCVGAGCQGWRK